jgi:hypothetical protein
VLSTKRRESMNSILSLSYSLSSFFLTWILTGILYFVPYNVIPYNVHRIFPLIPQNTVNLQISWTMILPKVYEPWSELQILYWPKQTHIKILCTFSLIILNIETSDLLDIFLLGSLIMRSIFTEFPILSTRGPQINFKFTFSKRLSFETQWSDLYL